MQQYTAHNPITDQANHHLPIAYLQSTVANMMGGTSKATDYMIFREKNVDETVDALLLSGNW